MEGVPAVAQEDTSAAAAPTLLLLLLVSGVTTEREEVPMPPESVLVVVSVMAGSGAVVPTSGTGGPLSSLMATEACPLKAPAPSVVPSAPAPADTVTSGSFRHLLTTQANTEQRKKMKPARLPTAISEMAEEEGTVALAKR